MTTSSQDDSFYDEGWANQWSDLKRYSPMGRHTRRWIHRLLENIPHPKTIADIGCGDGSLLAEISQQLQNIQLLGCDFSEVSIKKSTQRIPNGRFVVHDLRDPDNPFGEIVDVGINSEVIEHIDDDVGAVRNMASWCRHLIVTVPGGRLDDSARSMGHLRHYNESSLRQIVESAGLDVLSIRTWGFPFAYPFYARMRNRVGHGGVTGSYGPMKRLITHSLYGLFYLNDAFRGGNKLFLLARNPKLF